MINLKEIRNRIDAIGSTMKITNALKMVSASKLKKAQDAILGIRPYASKLNELIRNLMAHSNKSKSDVRNDYVIGGATSRILIVVISSNRGLCGNFNSSVAKKTRKVISEKYLEKNVDLYTIGKKINDIFSKRYLILKTNTSIYDDMSFKNCVSLARELTNLFLNGTYEKIEIIYNEFKNAAMQITTLEQFLPIIHIKCEEHNFLNYIFEPKRSEILQTLIPKSLEIQIYKILKSSFAAEQAARMTAMHKATQNAENLKEELLLRYNKTRQTAITNEILEIVGGSEALNEN